MTNFFCKYSVCDLKYSGWVLFICCPFYVESH